MKHKAKLSLIINRASKTFGSFKSLMSCTNASVVRKATQISEDYSHLFVLALFIFFLVIVDCLSVCHDDPLCT